MSLKKLTGCMCPWGTHSPEVQGGFLQALAVPVIGLRPAPGASFNSCAFQSS